MNIHEKIKEFVSENKIILDSIEDERRVRIDLRKQNREFRVDIMEQLDDIDRWIEWLNEIKQEAQARPRRDTAETSEYLLREKKEFLNQMADEIYVKNREKVRTLNNYNDLLEERAALRNPARRLNPARRKIDEAKEDEFSDVEEPLAKRTSGDMKHEEMNDEWYSSLEIKLKQAKTNSQ